jgi:hypothetical protein
VRQRQRPRNPVVWIDLGDGLSDAGAHAINGVASLGNAMQHHPGEVLAAGGGIGLMAVSAAGELSGVALDATGACAVVGVPLNVVFAAGMAAGVGMAGVAMASIASHTAGDDHLSPMDTAIGGESEEAGSAAGEPPKEGHPDGPTYKYRGKDAVVILNQDGEVVTAYAKGSAGLRNP